MQLLARAQAIALNEAVDYSQLTVIIPTLNEGKNIGLLIERLLELYPGLHVLVVDEDSSDNTPEIVQTFARDIDRTCGSTVSLLSRRGAVVQGITASVLEGIAQLKTEYFAVIDGDLQHPPEVLEVIFEKLLKGFDLVVGARKPYRVHQAVHRKLFTWISTYCAKLFLRFLGIKLSDPMSGLFAGRSDLAKEVVGNQRSRFVLPGYKVLFDFLRVAPRPLAVSEVPYQFGTRPGGYSKLRLAHAWYFFKSLFK